MWVKDVCFYTRISMWGNLFDINKSNLLLFLYFTISWVLNGIMQIKNI